ALADPGTAHRRLEAAGRRQRVAARRAGFRGQIGVEIHEDRPGQVPGAVGIDARRAAEPPADVEQDRRSRPGPGPGRPAHRRPRPRRSAGLADRLAAPSQQPLLSRLPHSAGITGRRHYEGYHTGFVLWVNTTILWMRGRILMRLPG